MWESKTTDFARHLLFIGASKAVPKHLFLPRKNSNFSLLVIIILQLFIAMKVQDFTE